MRTIFLISALVIGSFSGAFSQRTDSLIYKASSVKIKSLKKPIYIIDGIKQVDNDFAFSTLNADSIAEIKIIKNEDAVKMFGPEAIDGLILITTKSGKKDVQNLTLAKKLNQSATEGMATITDLRISKQPGDVDSTHFSNRKSKVLIRGLQHSASNINDVVYILDGQKIEKDEMNWISPDRIQSISILKKDSAIAQYGPQAGNGVVIITTKPLNLPKVQPKPVDKN